MGLLTEDNIFVVRYLVLVIRVISVGLLLEILQLPFDKLFFCSKFLLSLFLLAYLVFIHQVLNQLRIVVNL